MIREKATYILGAGFSAMTGLPVMRGKDLTDAERLT
jgi:hypothetical protein